jgi:hypothetical protein
MNAITNRRERRLLCRALRARQLLDLTGCRRSPASPGGSGTWHFRFARQTELPGSGFPEMALIASHHPIHARKSAQTNDGRARPSS